MRTESLVLGGDLGGTSTRILVVGTDGRERGRSTAAAGNPVSHPDGGGRGRCRHGLRASSSSQRQTVLTLTCSTSPQAMASSRTSATLKRLNGTARRAGNSQAIALTSAMTAGGRPAAAPAGPGQPAPPDPPGRALAPLGRGVRRDAQALAICLFCLPCAAASTTCARSTSRCSAVRRRTRASSTRRSSAVSTT
jgi:hypothetical protein